MPQRFPYSWGWWRIVMSPLGPPRTTRFVLCGYMLYMHPQGDGSYPGVRRVAEVTGLNKDTVAEHRELALRTGWLMLAPVGQRCHAGEVWTALPDAVFAALSSSTSATRYPQPTLPRALPSELLSGTNGPAVRPRLPDCPAPPDRSLRDPPISKSLADLRDLSGALVDIAVSNAPPGPQTATSNDRGHEETEALMRWLIAKLRAAPRAGTTHRSEPELPDA